MIITLTSAVPMHPSNVVIILGAVRGWRVAVDANIPTQPALHDVLDRHGCGVLAPCFDSVLRLYERCLRRRLLIPPMGATAISIDEARLLEQFAAGPGVITSTLTRIKDAKLTSSLRIAFDSTRIMIDLALHRAETGVRASQNLAGRSA